MEQLFSLSELHDALLLGFHVRWEAKILSLTLKSTSSKHAILTAVGLTNLSCSRLELWGPSISINSAAFSDGVLIIELQSGDKIRAEITSYELQLATDGTAS